jgi:hypothetical protein
MVFGGKHQLRRAFLREIFVRAKSINFAELGKSLGSSYWFVMKSGEL